MGEIGRDGRLAELTDLDESGTGALASAHVAVERWLFFAEAKHAVTLYYGSRSA